MLYLIATPIGNLADLSYRAVDILKNHCDYILAEDTRKTKILLDHYDIPCKGGFLKSFYEHNEQKEEKKVLSDLENNHLNIALVTDAGMPVLCDPGYSLTLQCIEKKIPFELIPGPSSLLHALVVSGLPPHPFAFFGFLPKKENERKNQLQSALFFPGTTIFFESPHRILSTLNLIHILSPTRTVAIARELTKKFEECLRGTAKDLIDHFKEHPPKGEMVLLLSKGDPFPYAKNLSIEHLLTHLTEMQGIAPKEALKIVAKLTHTKKGDLYKSQHHKKIPS